MLKAFASAALVAAIFVSAPAQADRGWKRGHGPGHGYDRNWRAPRHVYGYRGPVLHPRHYRRPSCLRPWIMWDQTGSPYWRLRYLACVL